MLALALTAAACSAEGVRLTTLPYLQATLAVATTDAGRSPSACQVQPLDLSGWADYLDLAKRDAFGRG